MSDQFRDRFIGGTLFLVALAWIAGSIYAIPDGFSGSSYGPRSIPLWLGVFLAVLSLIMLATSFQSAQDVPNPADADDASEAEGPFGKDELWAAAAVFGFLILLLGGMHMFGFLVSAIVLVALFLWLVLGSRSLLLTALLSVGLGVGIWYAMGRFLGVYLPAGMWGI